MADTNRPDLRNHDDNTQSGHADHKVSWLDGLPHNFDGWGPKTPDADVADDPIHNNSELTWAGDTDDRDHIVWNFQRARRHHH